MNLYMVESIRVKLASGLYNQGDLFLGLSGEVTKEEFEGVVAYTIMPEVRSELAQRIVELEVARDIYAQYQDDLRKEVVKAEAAELSGVKYSGFHDKKAVLDSILAGNISGLETIKLEELRKL